MVTSTNLLQNAWCTAKSTPLLALYKTNCTCFSFTLFRLTDSAISFYHLEHKLLVVSINIVNIWKPCKQNPRQLLLFKKIILEREFWLVTYIFKNWLFVHWELANILFAKWCIYMYTSKILTRPWPLCKNKLRLNTEYIFEAPVDRGGGLCSPDPWK